ncbi:MAG: uracil phosphoribosyltransferase [Patescibacteria group bacterium]
MAISEIEHLYGPRVHIIDDPLLATQLADLSSKTTGQPDINRLVRELYRALVRIVIATEFPRKKREVVTRMGAVFIKKQMDPNPARIHYTGLAHRTKAVCVDIARAGMLPSQVCYDELLGVLEPRGVRQDHLMMARTADAEGHVDGVDIRGSKIGGPIENRFVLFPDPMGATGTSLSKAISVYKREGMGTPCQMITLNLIITPEFIRRMRNDHPEVLIYALRLDRGLSSFDVQMMVPGTLWDDECGLTDNGYIVPGAGGLGEIINNTDD